MICTAANVIMTKSKKNMGQDTADTPTEEMSVIYFRSICPPPSPPIPYGHMTCCVAMSDGLDRQARGHTSHAIQ